MSYQAFDTYHHSHLQSFEPPHSTPSFSIHLISPSLSKEASDCRFLIFPVLASSQSVLFVYSKYQRTRLNKKWNLVVVVRGSVRLQIRIRLVEVYNYCIMLQQSILTKLFYLLVHVCIQKRQNLSTYLCIALFIYLLIKHTIFKFN